LYNYLLDLTPAKKAMAAIVATALTIPLFILAHKVKLELLASL
jgi:hypothetical protein